MNLSRKADIKENMRDKITYLCDTNLRSLLDRVAKLYKREDPPRLVNVFYDGDEFVAVLEWQKEEHI